MNETETNGHVHAPLGPWENDQRRVAIADALRQGIELLDELDEDDGEQARALQLRVYGVCMRLLEHLRSGRPAGGDDGIGDEERSN